MCLEVRVRAGDFLEGKAIVGANGLDDRVGSHGRVAAGHGFARQAMVQPVAVGTPLQAWQPGGALGRGQAVEDGHRGGHVLLQGAEHHRAAADVALVGLQAERKAVGQHQAGEEDQCQARGQGAWPLHDGDSSSCTGSEKT